MQLDSGRLIVGAFVHKVNPNKPVNEILELEYMTGLLYSDDHGETWHIGAVHPHVGTDEVSIVDTKTDGLYLNIRYNNRRPMDRSRGFARSLDGGETFSEIGLHPSSMSMMNVHCALTRLDREKSGLDEDVLLYSGPLAKLESRFHNIDDREDLTIWVSYDAGRNWPIRKQITTGNNQYSDLAVANDGSILCIYGMNTFGGGEICKIMLARFPIEVVTHIYNPCIFPEGQLVD